MAVGLAEMAEDVDMVQVVDVVIAINSTLAANGRAILRVRIRYPLPLASRKKNGKWSMMCKTCGWNTTHTTGFNCSYKDDPANFSLPTTHVYWTKSGKSPPTNGRGAPAPDVAAPPVASAASSISSRINPVITQYQTRTDDSEFNSFLADFQ